MQIENNTKLIKPSKAAAVLGVSARTVRRWSNSGILDCVRKNDARKTRMITLKSVLLAKLTSGKEIEKGYCESLNYLLNIL
ncbi:MAG: hypothetical protein LBH98_05980 [Chitinispirillales bacterium]|nr:hypothetical protein [Chitinispirillales bacterium]